jgi:hypothetical protein
MVTSYQAEHEEPAAQDDRMLNREIRRLRAIHNAIGLGEMIRRRPLSVDVVRTAEDRGTRR